MKKKREGFGFEIKLTKSLREPKKKKPSSIKKVAKLTFGILAIVILLAISTLFISYLIHLVRPGVKGNLHTHTTYSDGHGSYDEMIDEALRLGFDFIVITDHGYIRKIGEEVLEKCPKETRLLCIIGEEPWTAQGDMLAVGITEFIPDRLSVEETIERTHVQGGLAIPAHPGARGEMTPDTLIKIKDKIDAIECYNDKHFHELDYYWLKRYSKRENVSCVFDSDAHYIETLGDAYNVCDIEGELNKENLFNAIRQGKCKPRIKSFVKYCYYRLGRVFPFVGPLARVVAKVIRRTR